jgi:hypothetical protein
MFKGEVHIGAGETSQDTGVRGGLNDQQGLVFEDVEYRRQPGAPGYAVAERFGQVAHFPVRGAKGRLCTEQSYGGRSECVDNVYVTGSKGGQEAYQQWFSHGCRIGAGFDQHSAQRRRHAGSL